VVYFQETTSGSDNDAELGLFLANNNGAANKERLVIYKTDGTTPTAQHWFYSDGMAKHAGDLYTLGTLYATTNAQAPIFRDANNPNNYYADPASTSVFNHVQAVRYRDPDDAAGTTYFLDLSSTSQVNDFQARTFKDLDAPGSYWVDMNNTSQLNDVRANIFRDLANPNNYYVDPAGSSRLATTATDNSYTYGWFRNYNAGTGLYNEATGRHFYSQDANYWRQSSNVGTVYYDGANSTVRGYVYHDGTNIGFLPPDGNWQIRAWNSGVELYDTTYMATAHANILYDRDNPNNFYVDPTGTSRMVHGNFNYITTGSANDYNHFYSWTTLHGAYGLYSPEVNGAHFYPNNGTYGAWRIVGSRNSWYGLEFDTAAGQTSLMMGTTGQGWGSQQIGMHNNSQGWLWRFDHRTLNADGMNDFGGGNIDPSGTSSLADVNASCVARASCPSGWLQAGDTCISGNRGTGPWRNAVHDCATAYSAHLCSFAEYVAGRANGQITDSAWFWTADIQTSIPGMGSGTGSHLYPTIFNPGGYNPYNSADGFTYTDGWEWNYRYWRCCLKK
jgi:hypothetical protein